MSKKYVAVDIGASSGRLILAELDDKSRISLQEVHRFKNSFRRNKGHERWFIKNLVDEILKGLQKVKSLGIEKCTVGIDTWAVDYCLLDDKGNLLAEPVAYRDDRTSGAIEEFSKLISLEELYQKTGIQFQVFNTIFQLFKEDKTLLDKADKLLLIPDYLAYIFTGNMVMEETNASTMQLLNVKTRDFDEELLEIIGINGGLFPKCVKAGTLLGNLIRENFNNYNLPESEFITVASHDTASAVVGTPLGSFVQKNKNDLEDDKFVDKESIAKEINTAYISSGTWSLLGIENKQVINTMDAMKENYTNEWGINSTFRLLKNIMGMWLIQEIARDENYLHSYEEMSNMAKNTVSGIYINVNDELFLKPSSMKMAIKTYCEKTGQEYPKNKAVLYRSIYENLAYCYAYELKKLEGIINKKISKIHIVGGGSNILLLNQLTADITGIEVEAGPAEATAIGNIVVQMLVNGEFKSLAEARQCIKRSFDIKIYKPINDMSEQFEKYKKFIKSSY
jgi:Sugar (pentulose and hexulose) kinases